MLKEKVVHFGRSEENKSSYCPVLTIGTSHISREF